MMMTTTTTATQRQRRHNDNGDTTTAATQRHNEKNVQTSSRELELTINPCSQSPIPSVWWPVRSWSEQEQEQTYEIL
jgi:hypothetical protein